MDHSKLDRARTIYRNRAWAERAENRDFATDFQALAQHSVLTDVSLPTLCYVAYDEFCAAP